MFLADEAVIPLTQVPFLRVVFFEVSDALIIVILVPLIENELRVVNDPADDKLINLIVIKSAMALFDLTIIDGLEVLYNLLLFSQQNMILVLLSLQVQSLRAVILTLIDRLRVVAREIALHNALVIDVWWGQGPHRQLQLVDCLRLVLLNQVILVQTKYIQHIGHVLLSL